MIFADYIENLATRHVDIKHDPQNAIHFLSSESKKHTSIDSELCYPALILDRGNGFSFSGSPGAYFKDRMYILFILIHVSDTSNYQEINEAFQKSENILCDLINQMIEDKRNPDLRFLKTFKLEEVEVEFVENMDNSQYGVMAVLPVSETYKTLNCSKRFLQDRTFDETFDKSFN